MPTSNAFVAAAVFTNPGQPMEIHRLPMPVLNGGDVLVRIRLCSICGSDLHTFHGRRMCPTPTILGHEAVGEIAEFGPGTRAVDIDGQPLQSGQRITWSIIHNCGHCFFCLHHLPQKCENLCKFGHEAISKTHSLVGGISEYCHLKKGTAIVRIPDGLPDEIVCPCNCATATAAGVLRAAGSIQNEVVLVQGAGLLGLTACAMSHAASAREIIVTDVNSHRLDLARRFGATQCINVDDSGSSLAEAVHNVTEGRGVDLALELCGAPQAMKVGFDQLRIGARYVLAGGVMPAPAVSIFEETIVRRMLRIQGWHNYAPCDLRQAVQFLAQNHSRYPFAELLVDAYPLDEVNAAFAHASRSEAVRIAVAPNMGSRHASSTKP